MKLFQPYLSALFFHRTALLLLVYLWMAHPQAQAQEAAAQKRLHIGVFVPLYLDSAFDATLNYRYGKTLPSYMNPGIESYLGFQAAIDSLQQEKAEVVIHIYDSRSAQTNPETLLKTDSLSTCDLILGHVNVKEAALLARYALNRKIPFININLPNDAGSVRNPYHVILNPTLNTHCQGIYKFLQQNHPLDPVLLFSKTGNQDERIRGFFDEAEKHTAAAPLHFKALPFTDSLPQETLVGMLDSIHTNICIIGSLDLNTALNCCRQLATLAKTFPITVVGMPNWEQVDFTKSNYRGIEIVYGNSLYVKPDNKIAQRLQQQLKSRFFTRTTETTYRAFEALYAAAHLNLGTGAELLKQLQNLQATLFGNWEITPVMNQTTGQADYSENKKINFILKSEGTIKNVY